MAPTVFITGLTGYIGGDALAVLYSKEPKWQYRALIRDQSKAETVKKAFPGLETVIGGLDDAEILEQEAKRADIVLNLANCDHEGAARAITKGLAAHPTDQPGWLIHCSGSAIVAYPDIDNKTYGQPSDKVWSDIDNIEDIKTIPDGAPHRLVDKVVIGAAKSHGAHVRTAIVCPCLIYGSGRGPGNTKSFQLPELTRLTIARKEAFQVGDGQAKWSDIHVRDLSQLWYLLAVDAAAGGQRGTWGENGYYFAETGNGDRKWGDLTAALAKQLHARDHLASDAVKSLPAPEVNNIMNFGPVVWGANSRSRADRARKYLGWEPTMPSVYDTFAELIDIQVAAK